MVGIFECPLLDHRTSQGTCQRHAGASLHRLLLEVEESRHYPERETLRSHPQRNDVIVFIVVGNVGFVRSVVTYPPAESKEVE